MKDTRLKKQMVADLKNAIGHEWVTDDPAVGAAYSRDYSMNTVDKFSYPDAICLPENSSDISKIVIIANEYNVPVVPWSTGVNVSARAIPAFGGILIDFKRMNRVLEIDEESMIVVLEPYVQSGRIQMLLKQKGINARIGHPGAPSSVGALTNHFTTHGEHFQTPRYGFGGPKVIGAEIVLASGEIVRTGTLANEDWGGTLVGSRGPGPDLTSLFYTGCGTLGIVTKAAIKLTPIGEETRLYACLFKEAEFENYARCLAEVYSWETFVTAGAAGPGYFLPFIGTESMEDYMKGLETFKDVILAYFSLEGTKRQIEYWNKKLVNTVEKYKGTFVLNQAFDYRDFPSPQDDPNWQLMANLADLWGAKARPEIARRQMSYMFDLSLFSTVAFVAPRGGWHMKEMCNNFDSYIKMYKRWKQALKDHDYPDLDKGIWAIWFTGTPHAVLCEFDFAWDRQDPRAIKMMQAIDHDVKREYTKMGAYHPKCTHDEYMMELGPAYGEQFSLTKEVKKEIDPNNILNRGLMYPST